MEHIHTLTLVLKDATVFCDGCDIDLRLATYDEAIMIQASDSFAPDGPLLLNDNGVIVVPYHFSLFQEA